MITLLILFILVVIFLACFIGFNLNNICASLWLFKTFTNINVAILVLISFGAGIVFSLLLVLIAKLRSSMTNSAVETEVKKRVKSEKREKTEKKLNKFKKDKKSKTEPTEQLSDAPVNADN